MAPLTPDLAGRPTSRQQESIFCFLYQILFLDLYALNCKIFCPDLEGELPAVAVELWSDNLTHLCTCVQTCDGGPGYLTTPIVIHATGVH